MATISTSHQLEDTPARQYVVRRRSKRDAAPLGIACPHCHQRNRIFYSSLQRRKPIYKRAIFAYLRCHSCTQLFRAWRIGPALFTGFTIATLFLAGILGWGF